MVFPGARSPRDRDPVPKFGGGSPNSVTWPGVQKISGADFILSFPALVPIFSLSNLTSRYFMYLYNLLSIQKLNDWCWSGGFEGCRAEGICAQSRDISCPSHRCFRLHCRLNDGGKNM